MIYRAIKKTVKGFPRPSLDLTASNFGKIIENAMDQRLEPQFDPYANSLNYLIACYIIPYVGLTGYVGANPKLQSPQSKRVKLFTLFFFYSLSIRARDYEVKQHLMSYLNGPKGISFPYTWTEFCKFTLEK